MTPSKLRELRIRVAIILNISLVVGIVLCFWSRFEGLAVAGTAYYIYANILAREPDHAPQDKRDFMTLLVRMYPLYFVYLVNRPAASFAAAVLSEAMDEDPTLFTSAMLHSAAIKDQLKIIRILVEEEGQEHPGIYAEFDNCGLMMDLDENDKS
jgi:hypothetical protein